MLSRAYRSLFSKATPAQRHSVISKAPRRYSLSLETLERRDLMSASPVADQLIVQFKPGVSEEAKTLVHQEMAVLQHESLGKGHGADLQLVTFAPGKSLDALIQKLKDNPNVAYAEPNWILTKQAESNDPYYSNGNLWGMYGDDAPAVVGPSGTTNPFGSQAEVAWAQGNVGSNGVYVGIIDEGIDFNHPDLAANIWVNPFDPVDGIDTDGNGYIDDVHGWDFYQNNNSIYDGGTKGTVDAHGTHVAGTIGGGGGNGMGVAGVNWDVTMISGKFLGPRGGSIADAVKAVNYFTDLKTRHDLNIVALNNSWGGGGCSQAMHDAIIDAAKVGILFIAAAGNGGKDQVGDNNDTLASYPSNYNSTVGTSTRPAAAYDNVIAVAAITSTGARASFSNYGANTVDVGAPGQNIWSTTPNGTYSAYNGTSMATPHVSGAAALYAAANPEKTAAEIKEAILASAAATTSLAGKTATGGRLDIDALMQLSGSIDQKPTVSITSPINGATVSGTVTISANANDDQGVAKVEFFIGDVKIGEDIDGLDGWSVSWDTTDTTKYDEDAAYIITAVATDTATVPQTGSHSATVVVSNVENPPPPTSSNDMYVSGMTWATVKRGRFMDLYITIAVKQDANANGFADAGDSPVSGAAVTFQLTGTGPAGDRGAVGTAPTGSDGTVLYKFLNVLNGEVYVGTVTGLTHSSTLTWNTDLQGQVVSSSVKIENGSPTPQSQSLTALDVIAPKSANFAAAPLVVTPSTTPGSGTNKTLAKGKDAAEASVSLRAAFGKAIDDDAFNAFWAAAAFDEAKLLQSI